MSHQDVIIAGSGFTGLWSALYLKKRRPKQKITIVERGVLPTGASTRNAGFATFGSLSELAWDAQTMGTDKMLRVTEMRFKGLERIQKQFGRKTIDFDLCGGYELYDDRNASTEKLQSDMAYLNSLLKPITGSKKTFRLADKKINAFGFGGTKHLVENKQEGCLHSGKLLQNLLYTVQGMGVTVLNGVEITAIRPATGYVQLETGQAFGLSAEQLLVCTNAFTKTLLPELDITPARGQVLLTSPVGGLPFCGTFHSDEGYYYFRNLGNRVLLGGARNKAFADETTTRLQTTDFIQRELEDYLARVVLPGFQNRYTVDLRWAGIMAFGSEKMPVIKKISKNVFCAVRMSGVGVALAPVAAQQVTDLMMD